MSNKLSRENFRWEQPSQRLHHRSTAPLNITIEGHVYRALDWSLGGFRVMDFHHQVSPGVRLTVEVTVPFRDFEINFNVEGEVVRCNDDCSEVAARFLDMKDEHQELMRYFVQCLLTSEMVPVGDVIRRVDVPITPASELPDVNPTLRLPLHRRRFKSLIKSVAYLAVGGVLLSYVLVTLYSFFFRIQVESAVVSAPVEAVQSPIAGRFEQLYAKLGSDVRTGDPILKVTNSDISEALELAQIEVKDAQAELQEQEALLDAQKEQLTIYRQIGISRQEAAQASVDAAREKQQLTDAKLKRFQALFLKNLISETVLEEAEDDYILSQEGVKVAEAELAVAQNALKAVEVGRFFTGEKLEGSVPELEAAVTAARERLELAKEKLAAAQLRTDELSITAPFDGRIVKVLKSESNTVNRGEPLVLIERLDERVIDAYLTQQEVTQIGLNSPAIAYIPALGKRAEVRVMSIDRTTGFLDEVQSRFYWRGSHDRSANVKLTFEELGPAEIREQFPSGLPVVISFQRERANQILASAEQQLDDWAGHAATYTNTWMNQFTDWFNSNNSPIIAASAINVSNDVLGTASILAGGTDAASENCTSRLWPANSLLLSGTHDVPEDLIKQLSEHADEAMAYLPAPRPHLQSAGIADVNDPDLLATRRAFRDADHAEVLALAYRLTGKPIYQIHGKRILLAWADKHQPDGHPINETRLDGLLWTYDLLRCQLTDAEDRKIREWLSVMQNKKRAWQFGSVSSHNNHRTHQLKMLLLLDKILDDSKGWQQDIEAVKKHVRNNIHPTGETVDYRERDALHYHVYDLEAWTEIALLSQCCQEPVKQAFGFLQQRLADDDIHNEFANSHTALDYQRAEGGFDYAEKGGSYDLSRAIPAILSYNTMFSDQSPQLWEIVISSAQTERYTFKRVRYHLWQSS